MPTSTANEGRSRITPRPAATAAGDLRHVDPPVVFAASVAALFLLAVLAPTWPSMSGWLRVLGVVPVLIGVALHTWAWSTFRIAGTTVRADEQPTRLVRTGPYARTRNPMYLAGVLILGGLSIMVGSAVTLLAPVAYALVAHASFLPEEARRMEAEFGAEYEEYRSAVRAWL